LSKLFLIAVGKIKGGEAALYAEYAKRIDGGLAVREIASAGKAKENEAILAALPSQAFVVALDERGRDISSAEMAGEMSRWMERAIGPVIFVIGGADGLNEPMRARADFTLSLGRKTWPHKLARVMLVEQIYRAQQIAKGHPYHRE